MDATRAIREREGTRRAPAYCLAVTANAMKGDRDRCLKAAWTATWSKPIDLDRLTREMNRVMALDASSRAAHEASSGVAALPDLDLPDVLLRLGNDRQMMLRSAEHDVGGCPGHHRAYSGALEQDDLPLAARHAQQLGWPATFRRSPCATFVRAWAGPARMERRQKPVTSVPSCRVPLDRFRDAVIALQPRPMRPA